METKSLKSLKGNAKNPRSIGKEDYKNLVQSIKRFGDLSCIVFNVQTQQLAGGHQRQKAFAEIGADDIVITQRLPEKNHVGTTAVGYVMLNGERFGYREVDWDPDFEKAANVAANRIQGQFDLDLLAEITYEISQTENGADLLALTGQTEDEINRLLDMSGASGEQDKEEDETPEVDNSKPAISKLGEIYQLGGHRLMCGDSTDFGAVSDLLDGKTVSMIWTDPPYNAAFNGRSGNHDVIMNDEMKPEEFKQFLTDFATTMYALAPEVPKYICTDWKMYPLMYSLMQKPSACIIWVKNMFGMGNGYRHQHEFIIFEGSLEANDKSDVWEIKRDNGAEYEHPTQKPVELSRQAIVNSTKRGEVVLDFFSGSGSSLIACDSVDRIFCGMELDPKYCDVIRKRYYKHTTGSMDGWEEATKAINEVNDEAQSATIPTA